MKSVRRNNPKEERLGKLRPPNAKLPSNRDPNRLPLADKVSATEQKIRKEIAIMKKLRHPHVVRLYEVIDDHLQSKIYMSESHAVAAFSNATRHVLSQHRTDLRVTVMEYLGGGEVKWRNDDYEPVLSVSQTRRIIRDAVLGLEYRKSVPSLFWEQSQNSAAVHYQGIIHRDIKPANLLWTEDRRQVKIGDFGVSHFSYAQRLTAAGKAAENEHPEAFLMDDSDLSKRAGTPSFLAPEVIWEYSSPSPLTSQSELASPRSTGTLHSLTSHRPPVTKSIDIWALGVTLYCLLFGKVPFTPFSDHGGEFELYRVICNSDWDVGPTMGADEVPTGGRHPSPPIPGAPVILLLDRFLQKDVQNRITLDEVKVRAPLTPTLPCPFTSSMNADTSSSRLVMVHRLTPGYWKTYPTLNGGSTPPLLPPRSRLLPMKLPMRCRVYASGGIGVLVLRGDFPTSSRDQEVLLAVRGAPHRPYLR
jgi:[calcium/calmodulin-dependent protein kinase] kinase